MLNKLLLDNPINVEIICDYIIAKQNEINIIKLTNKVAASQARQIQPSRCR